MKGESRKIIIAVGIIGLIMAVMVRFGNPINLGVCVPCYYEDLAATYGLQSVEIAQYIRPELLGFLLGAFILAKIRGEFKTRGGSSPILRFVLGFFMMIGILVFLSCPSSTIFRLATGDLNAVTGLVGHVVGIYIGIQFIKRGFSLGNSSSYPQPIGYIAPLVAIVILAFLILKPAFALFSGTGPDAISTLLTSMVVALAAGLIIGAILQRTSFCTTRALRDAILFKNFTFLWALIAIFIVNVVATLILNPESIYISFYQLEAHSNHLWNFLAMLLTGITAVFLGACPLRQIILAGEGDTDAVVTILGLIAGVIAGRSFDLAATPLGVPTNGKIAVLVGIVVSIIIGVKYKKGVVNEKRDNGGILEGEINL